MHIEILLTITMTKTHIVTPGDTFETGTKVHAAGTYVCAPCGYTKELEHGEIFPECDSCMRKADEDPDDVAAPSGIWEYKGAREEV